MALCLLIAGSYAAYQAQQKAAMALNNAPDESIRLTGKTKVELLPGEQLALLEVPLTCINWFDGDYQAVVPFLQQRVNEIVAKNPWLAGWLLMDEGNTGKLMLLYDKTGQDLHQGIFRVLDTAESVEAEAASAAAAATDDFETEAAKKEDPTASLIMNKTNYRVPVISIHTRYDDCTQQLKQAGAILPLQQFLVGKDNAPLIRLSVIPDAVEPTKRFAVVLSMSHALGDAHTLYKILNMLDVNSYAQQLMVERDAEYNPAAKRLLGDEAFQYLVAAVEKPTMDLTATRSEPTVLKAFHVQEEWFFQNNTNADETEKSTSSSGDDNDNDAPPPPRARRSSLFANAAQDYNAKAAMDTVSENSMIASWFFKLNQADVAFMGLTLRDRLQPDCSLSDFHAGNYTAGIPYTPIDYATPALIERSVASLKRCGGGASGDGGADTITKLPPFRWNNSASLSMNFACHLQRKIQLSSSASGAASPQECRQRSHMMLFDSDIFKASPGRLSLCVMFTSVPEDTTGDEDEGKKKRAGVLVLCRKSVWERIEKSGIVDEMLIDS